MSSQKAKNRKPGARPALTTGARVHLLNSDGSVNKNITYGGTTAWLVERMYVQRGVVLADVHHGPASKSGVRLNRLRAANTAVESFDS